MSRRLVPERMDDPSLDAAAHRQALVGLRRINSVSRTTAQLYAPIAAFARRRGLSTLRLLDVACGGGDVPLALASMARERGLHVQLTLADRSDVALAHATEAGRRDDIDVRAHVCDAVSALPAGTYDVVTNSLFLHHLVEPSAIAAMTNMWVATSGLLLVSDLRRSNVGWVAAQFACRTLSRSPVVHYDGPVSVGAAWTVPELRCLARRAGIDQFEVGPTWPWRMLLTAERCDG